MKSTMRFTIMGLALAAAVAGCGGGGGGGEAGAPAGPSPQSFLLRSTWDKHVVTAFSSRYVVGGTLNGAAVTGSGSVTVSAPSAASFEGRSALRKTETLAGTLTVAGMTVPYSAERQLYFDTASNPLGGVGDDYVVVSGTVLIPTMARVGDAATLYAAELYASSTKQLRTGTAQVSFALRADTVTTALLSLVTEKRNTVGQLTSTDTVLLRITPSGEATRVSESSVMPGSNTDLTFSY